MRCEFVMPCNRYNIKWTKCSLNHMKRSELCHRRSWTNDRPNPSLLPFGYQIHLPGAIYWLRCATYVACGVQRVKFYEWKWWNHNMSCISCMFDVFLNIWLVLKFVVAPNILTRRLHIPSSTTPSLGHWYTGVYLRICILGQSNPFLGLCSPSNYGQPIVSNWRSHLQLYRNGV